MMSSIDYAHRLCHLTRSLSSESILAVSSKLDWPGLLVLTSVVGAAEARRSVRPMLDADGVQIGGPGPRQRD